MGKYIYETIFRHQTTGSAGKRFLEKVKHKAHQFTLTLACPKGTMFQSQHKGEDTKQSKVLLSRLQDRGQSSGKQRWWNLRGRHQRRRTEKRKSSRNPYGSALESLAEKNPCVCTVRAHKMGAGGMLGSCDLNKCHTHTGQGVIRVLTSRKPC